MIDPLKQYGTRGAIPLFSLEQWGRWWLGYEEARQQRDRYRDQVAAWRTVALCQLPLAFVVAYLVTRWHCS